MIKTLNDMESFLQRLPHVKNFSIITDTQIRVIIGVSWHYRLLYGSYFKKEIKETFDQSLPIGQEVEVILFNL